MGVMSDFDITLYFVGSDRDAAMAAAPITDLLVAREAARLVPGARVFEVSAFLSASGFEEVAPGDHPAPAGRLSVAGAIARLAQHDLSLEVWVEDDSSSDGFVPADGFIGRGSDDAPAPGDPEEYVFIGTRSV